MCFAVFVNIGGSKLHLVCGAGLREELAAAVCLGVPACEGVAGLCKTSRFDVLQGHIIVGLPLRGLAGCFIHALYIVVTVIDEQERVRRPVCIQGVVVRVLHDGLIDDLRAADLFGEPAVEGVAVASRSLQFAVFAAEVDLLGVLRIRQRAAVGVKGDGVLVRGVPEDDFLAVSIKRKRLRLFIGRVAGDVDRSLGYCGVEGLILNRLLGCKLLVILSVDVLDCVAHVVLRRIAAVELPLLGSGQRTQLEIGIADILFEFIPAVEVITGLFAGRQDACAGIKLADIERSVGDLVVVLVEVVEIDRPLPVCRDNAVAGRASGDIGDLLVVLVVPLKERLAPVSAGRIDQRDGVALNRVRRGVGAGGLAVAVVVTNGVLCGRISAVEFPLLGSGQRTQLEIGIADILFEFIPAVEVITGLFAGRQDACAGIKLADIERSVGDLVVVLVEVVEIDRPLPVCRDNAVAGRASGDIGDLLVVLVVPLKERLAPVGAGRIGQRDGVALNRVLRGVGAGGLAVAVYILNGVRSLLPLGGEDYVIADAAVFIAVCIAGLI